MSAPPCASDPRAFDLDVVGHDPLAVHLAQAVCSGCPMRQQCLAAIIRTGPDRTRGVIQGGLVLHDDKGVLTLPASAPTIPVDPTAAHRHYERLRLARRVIPPSIIAGHHAWLEIFAEEGVAA